MKQFLTLACLFTAAIAVAQVPSQFTDALRWRNIGPWRGGRSLAVAGHADQPNTFYFGATGGGVWKTFDGGKNWGAISDTTFKSSSVGSIAVAPSAPDIVYVGMGEAEIRSNISYGDGMYRSDNAGKTWQSIGLKKSFAIGRVAVHPTDPQTVYVAAMGQIFGKNDDRGVFRTRDGGKSWQKILFHSDSVGAVEVAINPANPNVIIASMWNARRGPHYMSTGGTGSGFFISHDGGDSWKPLHERPGMPKGLLGKIEVAFSPTQPSRIWAMLEHDKYGGLYRSDNGGETWKLLTQNADLKQRPWYFSEIVADPTDPNTIYVLNVNFWRSRDGGATFSRIGVGHGDCHDLWINPKQPLTMIMGDDGGAEITTDGGQNWTDLDLPTAQFYHVSVDNNLPNYGVYGAQQDNSAIKIKARTNGSSIGENDFYEVAGGESGYVVSHPTDPDITFGGSYQGFLTRHNYVTGENKLISPWPVNALGAGSEASKYRFQWTFPIVVSPHDPNLLYVTSQYVHKSSDQGHTWALISPVLTRNDPNTLKSSGGPLTQDNTGAEMYSTIFSFNESPVKAGILWAGSDDGWVQVSQDNGKNWSRCTPAGLPEWALITSIIPDNKDASTCYLTATRYKLADGKPYVFVTRDFGVSWNAIVTNLPDGAWCRAIRQDPKVPNLLYLGTEIGIFATIDSGKKWFLVQGNLPLSPIHDIAIQPTLGDVVVATHGRSFWILDNQEPLRQLALGTKLDKPILLQIEPHTMTTGGSYFYETMQRGENAPENPAISYYLPDTVKAELRMVFLSGADTVATWSSVYNQNGKMRDLKRDIILGDTTKSNGFLPNKLGLNTFYWDMRFTNAVNTEPEALLWAADIRGPKAMPGQFQVQLYQDKTLIGSQALTVLLDPRIKDFNPIESQQNLAFQLKVRDQLSTIHKAINTLRQVRSSIDKELGSITDTAARREIAAMSKPLLDTLLVFEQHLIQSDAKAVQDLLAKPPRLNDMIGGLASAASTTFGLPTAGTLAAYDELSAAVKIELDGLKSAYEQYLPPINQAIRAKQSDPIRW
jgi:photosystem II stability/assembly factor-like uncharacterized protein